MANHLSLFRITTFISFGLLICVVLLASAAFWFTSGIGFSKAASLDQMNEGKWYRLELPQKLVATDGSDLTAMVRKGRSEKIIIFFQGGGMAWDAESAANPSTTMSLLSIVFAGAADDITERLTDAGYYQGEIIWPWLYVQTGLFEFDREDNPFSDWSIIYIPYASGDAHTGNAVTEYTTEGGERVVLQHRGAANTDAILRWVYAEFPSPDRVLVAGSSAGAFASTVWVNPIARHYADAKVYGYADGIYLDEEKVAKASRENWGNTLEKRFGVAQQSSLIDAMYESYQQNPLPNVTYLQSNTTRDEVIALYLVLMAGADAAEMTALLDDWSESMLRSAQRWRESSLPYYSYITDHGDDDGMTQHTFLQFGAMYSHREDGLTPMEWLAAAVIEDSPISVGTSLPIQ